MLWVKAERNCCLNFLGIFKLSIVVRLSVMLPGCSGFGTAVLIRLLLLKGSQMALKGEKDPQSAMARRLCVSRCLLL